MKDKYEEIYAKIRNAILKLIPDEWNKIWFYGEVLKDATNIYYYFKSEFTDKLVCCMDIPKEYGLDEDDYYESFEETEDLVEVLHSTFKKNNEKLWTNFTLIFDEDGKYDINFDYTDISIGKFSLSARHAIWEYNVLNMKCTDSYSQNVIAEYLSEK